MKFHAFAAVPSNLPGAGAFLSDNMVVGDGSSEVSPGIVVVANVSEAARLGDTTVDVEVSVSNVGTDAKTSDSVTTISVDTLDIDSVFRFNAIGVVIP